MRMVPVGVHSPWRVMGAEERPSSEAVTALVTSLEVRRVASSTSSVPEGEAGRRAVRTASRAARTHYGWGGKLSEKALTGVAAVVGHMEGQPSC
jgi:hypothetical protein